MKALLVLVVLALGCTEQQLRVATIATDALITCDVGQTYYVSDHGRWDRTDAGYPELEMNPLLGSAPPPHLLALDLALAIGANTAVGYSHLPRWLRTTYLVTVGAIESLAVIRNARIGGACGLR